MKYSLWYEAMRIPASPIITLLREDVGRQVAPWWNFLVLGILFGSAFYFTKTEEFMWCGSGVFSAFMMHFSHWISHQPIAPEDEGTSNFGADKGALWQQFGEPCVALIGGFVAFYYHAWIIGTWVIFSAFCLWMTVNPSVRYAALRYPEYEEPELPDLTLWRIILAFVVAALADLVQVPITLAENSGLLAIPGEIADVVVDFLAMGATTFLLGFHKLLLPSLLVEAIPELDVIPSWTGCVAYVVWRRKKDD